jgi:ketosteroid isomerase-like protein
MAGRKATAKIVLALYDARKRGDYDAMAELCASNGVLRIAGDEKLCPIAGTTKGRKALRSAFEKLGAFRFKNQKMVAMAIDGNTVAVHWRVKIDYKGKSHTSEFCDLWTIRKGKMASSTQFIDTALVREMMG